MYIYRNIFVHHVKYCPKWKRQVLMENWRVWVWGRHLPPPTPKKKLKSEFLMKNLVSGLLVDTSLSCSPPPESEKWTSHGGLRIWVWDGQLPPPIVWRQRCTLEKVPSRFSCKCLINPRLLTIKRSEQRFK